jgi:hypothetical protein
VTKEEEKKRKELAVCSQHQLWPGTPDSVRCARLADGELGALRKTQRCTAIIHRTVRGCTGLSGEPMVASANGRLRNPRAMRGPQQRSVGHTGQCPVCQPTPRTNGWMLLIWKKIAHRIATVTIRSDTRQVWPSKLASNGS